MHKTRPDKKVKRQPNAGLTKRELEIIRLLWLEKNAKQIAESLFISERTVETHRKNIYRKTKTNTLIGLIKYVFKNKLFK